MISRFRAFVRDRQRGGVNLVKGEMPVYIRLADSTIKRFPDLSDKWDHEYGVVLKGMEDLWKLTNNNKYFGYIKIVYLQTYLKMVKSRDMSLTPTKWIISIQAGFYLAYTMKLEKRDTRRLPINLEASLIPIQEHPLGTSYTRKPLRTLYL